MNQDEATAKAHIEWYMGLLREQMKAWMDITERLLLDNFIHGMKHGREAYFCSEDKYKDYIEYVSRKRNEDEEEQIERAVMWEK